MPDHAFSVTLAGRPDNVANVTTILQVFYRVAGTHDVRPTDGGDTLERHLKLAVQGSGRLVGLGVSGERERWEESRK
jgi:hypothetical protein